MHKKFAVWKRIILSKTWYETHGIEAIIINKITGNIKIRKESPNPNWKNISDKQVHIKFWKGLQWGSTDSTEPLKLK